MASSRPTVGEVEISAFVKIDQRSVADGIKSIESQAKRAGSAVTKLNRPLGEITGNVTEFSKSLEASNARVLAFGASAGAIYALSRSFKFLVDSMIQVEKELKDINVILGASEKQLKGFSKELFNIAGATGQSFKTVAVAAKELSRQGLSMEQTLLRTRDALILTRLSGMDAESAVASLTAAINTFNRSMLDSTKIVNKMANVDAAFAVSTQDLAEAMKRVGSTAQDVSVDFNQLLGAVTSLQQTTARGGPVIGNGLKSIFTRIQRTDTLDQLESLGVAVRGLQGDMLPAMQVLTNLAKAFPALTKAQQAHTAETVAGVFQMNTLRALLNDLGKGYSVYEQAVRTATNSTNQAIERNEELNKTLDAQIKKLSARLIQAAKSGGDMLLGPAVQNITGVLDKVLGDAEKGSGSIGAKIGRDIAKGALEGLGKMLAGPGLIALVAVGVKIGKNLSKFLVEATLDMFNMQNASMKIAATEKVITDELSRQSVLQDQYLKGLITRRDLELQVLSAVSARSKQEAAAGAFVTRTATSAVQRGGGMGPSGKFSTGRSSGYIPNFVSSAESTMERAGAVRGGYAPGSVRKTNIAGLGSVTYNSAESVKHVPGFAQPFINPPGYSRAGKAHQKKSIKETGIDPYASYGVVPNFVRYMTPTSARMKKVGLGKADKMMTMTDLVEMVRQGPGKGGRAFSVTFRDSSGAIHTQAGQRAKYEAYGKGRASHYEEDGLGYLRWNPMDQNKRSKGNNPKAFREARLDRIMNISFDKKQYSMDPTRLGPDGLPSMVLTGVARSSGHVPNFSRFGGAKFPVPIMPFHGSSVGRYEGYKSTKAFQKPGAKGGTSFQNYKDFNNALSRTFGGNLKDNVVYPGQIGSTARSQGLASLLGPTIGVQNVLAHPAYQKFSKMATPLGFQPNKGSVTELLQSIVNQAPKNALGYYRSKDYSNLFEELVGLGGGANLANPGFGIKGASNFMGTAGLPTVEGMMKHGGQTRFMEIKASDSADNMSRLLGKSMQLYPDKYRSLAQKYATPSDFKIIDNFLGKFSNKPKFASGMEEAAYKTGGRFVDSYMSGGHVPSFANNPLAAAFSREKKASGLPGSQIYATTVHTPNYSGPVVGNKRDEPTYGSLRKAVINHPDPARAGMSRGNVPNFAALDMIPGYGLFKGMQNFFDKELKDLEKQFKEDVKASKALSQETRSATKTTQRSQARMDVLNARINDLNGLTEQSNKLEQKGGAKASVLRDPGLLRQQMRSLDRLSSRGLIENLDKGTVKTLKTQVSALLGDTLTTAQRRSISGTKIGTTGFKAGQLLQGKSFLQAQADLQARGKTLRGTAGFMGARDSQKAARSFLSNMGVDTKGMKGNTQILQAMKGVESSVNMASKQGQGFQRIMLGLEAQDVKNRQKALNQFATQVATGTGTAKAPGLQGALNAFSMAKGGLLFDKKGAPVIDPKTGQQRTTKLAQQQAARQATLESARLAEEEKRQRRDTASRQAGETKQSMRQQKALGTGFGGFMARNPMVGMQAGMALSFLGPMAGGAMAQALGGPTKAQRRNAAIAQGFGTTVGYAATGGMLATMGTTAKAGAMGGPKGLAIGAVAGLALGVAQSLFTVSSAMESISSDVRQAYEAENKAKEEAASATSKFVKSQNAYIEAMERGAGAQTLDALKQKTIESLVQIGDPNLTRKLLAAGNDPNKVADVNAEIQRKNEAQKKIFGERGAIEQMVNAGKAETISEAGLKAIASDIALFANLGKGPVTEASLKKAGIDTSSDLLEGFVDLMDGDVVGSLIVFIEAKRKEIAAAKKASGAQTASAKALLRLREATMAAISAKEADLRLADLFHSGAAKMREVVNGLEQNVSSFRTMDKQLKLSIENNKRSLVMDNTILMQRAGQSLLSQGTKGVTSGFGTSGQQAMGQLGGILMAGNQGPAKTMQDIEGVLSTILNDPTISQKDKSGIQQQMDKLATEMAENTAKTAIQNNLIELQTAVEKSNIDFRQRMNMQGQGLGGGGNGLGFMNAVLSLSGQQSGALNRSQELGARAQGFETLRGMGFDLNRGGLGDTFRSFQGDRFKSEAANQLDFLLGDTKLTKKLIDPNTSMKEAESLIRGANSKQGDIVNQIVRTLKSPEIDKARSDIEGSIQKEQAILQSSLVDIIGGNTQMLNQLIQSQSNLIDSNGNLAAVLKTMPETLAQRMGKILSGYNQQQVNQAAGKAGTTMMQMNAGKVIQGGELDRFLNPQKGPQNPRGTLGSLLKSKGFQNLFTEGGVGNQDVMERRGDGGAMSYRLFPQGIGGDDDFGVGALPATPNQRFQDAFRGAGVAIPGKLKKPDFKTFGRNSGFEPSAAQKKWINEFRDIMQSDRVTSAKNSKEFEAAVASEYEKQGGMEVFGMPSDHMVKVARQVVANEGKAVNNKTKNTYPAYTIQNQAYQQSANQITGGAGNLANILTGTGGAVNPRTGMALPASTNLQGMQKHLSDMLAKQQEFNASGDKPNVQVMGGHIQKLKDHMTRTATAQGLVNPHFNPAGTLVHQPQAYAQGGGLVPLAAPGAQLPAGATALPPAAANVKGTSGLVQVGKNVAAVAQASMERTKALIDQLSATTQLGNFAGKNPTLNIKEFIKTAAKNRANMRSSSELLVGQQEGAIMAQGGSVPSFRRQANRGILEKQASVLQEAIATAQKTIETEQDATKKANLLAVVKADQAALGLIETELSENYIKERAEEINQLKRKGTLTQELNGGLAMGHTAEQQLLTETQAKTQQLIEDIMTGRENGKTEEELADKKKELKELFAQTPAQEFNSALSLFIQETNKLRGELEDGSAKRKAIEQQKRSDLDLDTQLMLETGVNRNPLAMSMQKKREQLAIEKAKTGIQLGTGSHGQLAQAQNSATTAALRRGDIDVGEALRRQMASKVMANKGDYKEQILNDVADLSNKMSGHFASAWESFVTGASSGKDALKGFASAVAMEMQRLLFKHTIGRVMDNVFSSAFGALGAASSAGAGARQAGGYIPKRYNSGGMVTGGSGYRDDVPAMMSGGEFVIRKSSVNKYGSGLMNALNSGSVPKMNKGGPSRSALMGEFSEVDFESAPTFAGRSGARGNFSNARSRGVSMGLANAFLMNDPDRPGRGFSRVNRRLSNRALRSDSLVQSKFRRSRADKFMSYHEYLRGEFDRRQEARQNFRDQKAATLQAGMINAAVSGVIAGGMTYRNLNSPKIDGETGFTAENIDAAKAQGFSNREIKMFQDSGVTLNPSGLPNMARGGLIKRFAMGGSNRDSVPALLMGGEYVMNRQATNKYGASFMNRLNRGQISGFQNGGYVGGTGLFDGAGQVDNALSSDKIVRLVDLTENINRLMEESSVKEAEVREGQNPDSPESSSGGIVNHINISINTAAGQPAEADVETKTEASGGDQADDQSTERSIEDNEKLADSLRSVVLDTIVKEQRPGGLLSK